MRDARDAVAEFTTPDTAARDYRELGLLPFGQTGAGDVHCFLHRSPLEIEGDDMPVVLAPHDAPEVEVLAKNFQDFVFSHLLEGVSEFDDDSLIAAVDLRETLANTLRSHHSLLSDRQFSVLEDVYGREPNTAEDVWSLISLSEMNEVLEREIGFPKWNHVFDVG